MKYILMLFLILSFIKCNKVENENKNSQNYFDLKAYCQAQIKQLNTNQPKVSKSIQIAGQTESKISTETDWMAEFQLFINSDLNKTSFKGLYQVDSTFKDNELNTITLEALEEKCYTKMMEIRFKNKKVQEITISNAVDNLLYQKNESLHYIPEQLLSIHKTERMVFGENKESSIKLQFVLPK